MTPPTGLKFALEIAALGYRVFPVNWRQRKPAIAGWQDLASNDPLDVEDMWLERPKASVGVATGEILAVDLDEKDGKHGISAWIDWCREAGIPVPDFAQKTLSGGAHVLYRMEDQFGLSTGTLPKGIDIRGVGGLIFVYQTLPPLGTLEMVPEALRVALSVPEKTERRSGDVTVRDPALGLHPYAERAIGYELARLDACAAGAPYWNNTTYEVACNLIEFANSGWSGYTLERALSDHAERAPQDPGFGPKEIQKCWDSAEQKVGSGDREEPEGDFLSVQEVFGQWTDEEEAAKLHRIFDATPILQHIRQAAHARMVGSGALLVNILGRVLAAVPPGVMLPPTIGSLAPLNLGFALVGRSGDGKSAVFSCGSELFGTYQEDLEIGVGSGEGLIESFLEEQKVPDPRDPTKTILKKVLVDPPSRILNVDEVDHLGKASGRDGSTIMSILRTAITGGALKSANATAERRRSVQSKSYRLVVFVGVQPALSGILLNDSDAGTPQRLLWISTKDKTQPRPKDRPEWPGPLDWWGGIATIPNYVVQYPESIANEILDARFDRQQDTAQNDLESHIMMTKLKVAAALAFLHDEVDITDQWWKIAGYLMEWSQKEQAMCRSVLGEVNKRVAKAKGASAVVEEDTAHTERTELVKKRILSMLEKGDRTVSSLGRSLSAPQRDVLEKALAELEETKTVVVENSEYKGQTNRKVCLRKV